MTHNNKGLNMTRLKDIRQDNWIVNYLYENDSIHDKINRRSVMYLWSDGIALKDFNRATRHYLNTVDSLEVEESEVINMVLKLK